MNPPLQVLPLGGSGEVGLNATRYTLGDSCLVVDFGALLGIEDLPSVSKLVPGTEPLEGRGLVGLVLTHGHEDHIGGVGHLLERIKVPVHGFPLPLEMVRSRLRGSDRFASTERKSRFVSMEPGQRVELGPFEIELVSVTHSIPDTAMVVIRGGGMTVVHTGDFKLDRAPALGGPSDVARLEALGQAGVDLLMSDSTNAERPGRTPSETSVVEALRAWIRTVRGRAVVTFVSSHLHRMQALAEAAEDLGRKAVVLGRSMGRNLELAERLDLFSTLPRVSVDEAARLPPESVLVLATGSQGEPGGAMARLARGEMAPLHLAPGDAVAFSARVIPGRELSVRKLRNRLVQRGIDVVTAKDLPIHSSGHAQQDEQADLLRWLQPRNFAPMHGDRTMLEAHAATARRAGLTPDQVWVFEDGQSIEVRPGGRIEWGPVEDVPRVPVDDAGRSMTWAEAKERRKIAQRGLVTCTVWVDDQGAVAGPVAVDGFGVELSDADRRQVAEAVRGALRDPSLISIAGMEDKMTATVRQRLGINRQGPWVASRVIPDR